MYTEMFASKVMCVQSEVCACIHNSWCVSTQVRVHRLCARAEMRVHTYKQVQTRARVCAYVQMCPYTVQYVCACT